MWTTRATRVCCEMWPGNTADVTSLIPVIKRIKGRFNIGRFCIVCDRGMISQDTLIYLEEEKIHYIVGARMRRVKEIKKEVLSRAGRYREVYPEGVSCKDPSPLKVKEVMVDGRRYILCLNERQARKEAVDRQAMLDALREKIRTNPKSLVGNKGFRKYLSLDRETLAINPKKIAEEQRYDGKWVLRTNTELSPEQTALKYKELWQVEQVFRDMKSVLETRPIYHQTDETIRGHVFCSFLALVLRKENWMVGWIKPATAWSGQTSNKTSRPFSRLQSRMRERNSPSGVNAWGYAEQSSRRSVSPFPRPFERYNDTNQIFKEPPVVPKTFSQYLSI